MNTRITQSREILTGKFQQKLFEYRLIILNIFSIFAANKFKTIRGS